MNKQMKPFILNYLSKSISDVGITRGEALKQKRCCKCGKEATKFKDELSKKEYNLTAWCQSCQDEYYG